MLFACFCLRGIINREVNVTKKLEDYPSNIDFQLFAGYYVHIEEETKKDDFELFRVRIGNQSLWVEKSAVDERHEYATLKHDVSLRSGRSMKSPVLNLLFCNSEIIILDNYTDFFEVDYRGQRGYIPVDATNYRDTDYAGQNMGEKAVSIVRSKLGCKYVWAGQGPNEFDCSGLMQYAYNRLDIFIMRDAHEQIEGIEITDRAALLPGDIITFYTYKDKPDYISHVGMYVGNGIFIHASTNGYIVREQVLSEYPYKVARMSRYFDV